MASVYIETSIPSYYHETRTSPSAVAWRNATREWWDQHRSGYSIFTSVFVTRELLRSPPAKAARMLQFMDAAVVLDEPAALQDVVQFYHEHHLMPMEAGGDAFHLAMASLAGMDYLLTWNCRHLANANKVQHIRVLNGRLGLHVPIITTPLTLIPEKPK